MAENSSLADVSPSNGTSPAVQDAPPQGAKVAQFGGAIDQAREWLDNVINGIQRADDFLQEAGANLIERIVNNAREVVGDRPQTARFPLRVGFGDYDERRPNVPVTDLRAIATPNEPNDPDPQFGFALSGREDLQVNGNRIENFTLVPENPTAEAVLDYLRREEGLNGFAARYGIEGNPDGTGQQPALYVQGSGVRLGLAFRAVAREQSLSAGQVEEQFVNGLALQRNDLILSKALGDDPQQPTALGRNGSGEETSIAFTENLVASNKELPQTPEVQRLKKEAQQTLSDIYATVPEAQQNEPAFSATGTPPASLKQDPQQEQQTATQEPTSGPQLA